MENTNREKDPYPYRQNQMEGRNAVLELLKSGREIENIYVSSGEKEGSITRIIAQAKSRGVVIKEVNRKKLDFMRFLLGQAFSLQSDAAI